MGRERPLTTQSGRSPHVTLAAFFTGFRFNFFKPVNQLIETLVCLQWIQKPRDRN